MLELQQRLFKKVVCFKLILGGESSMALQLYNHVSNILALKAAMA